MPIAAGRQASAKHDVVIRNGGLDGRGTLILAGFAIANGRIVAVGRVTVTRPHRDRRAGEYVSPGWID